MRLTEGGFQRRRDHPPQAGQVCAASAVPIRSAAVHGLHSGQRYSYCAITSHYVSGASGTRTA
jgi:hypothetical protein